MDAPLLEIARVTRTFEGLVALQEVSLRVQTGQIKGLIGPNGAGKTTLFNIITGALSPSAGAVHFRSIPLVGLPPYRIASLGIARTFQNMEIFHGVSVLDHVLIGLHRRMQSGLFDAMVRSPRLRQEEAQMHAEAMRLLAQFDLTAWARTPAEILPFGLQRILEIARAIATSPHLLLLDEPGAGLNPSERTALAAMIRRIRDQGVTILLVEHDMQMLMGLADEVAVLDRGLLLAEGPPTSIRTDPRVIAAYLGEETPDVA